MITMARMALQPGMELAEDVTTPNKGVILKARTVLDSSAIEKLTRHGIMCVSIMEPEDYATTYYEKIAASKAFSNFKAVYQNNLKAYKYMINSFFEAGVPLNSNYLLKIYEETRESVENGDLLLDMLYSLVPTEDNLTYAHCFNSALIAGVFSSLLAHPEDLQRNLILSGYLYDIGKLKLPDNLLWKPGKLTSFEYNWVKTHTTLGYDLLKSQNLDPAIMDAVASHHERCDGSGYPTKCRGNEIPYTAKFIGIVDSYEAMTAARTYRAPLCPFQLIANFERGGLYQYDMESLTKILEHFACRQIGRTVRLSNEAEMIVRIINPGALSRPILETCDRALVDLRTRKELSIVAVL